MEDYTRGEILTAERTGYPVEEIRRILDIFMGSLAEISYEEYQAGKERRLKG